MQGEESRKKNRGGVGGDKEGNLHSSPPPHPFLLIFFPFSPISCHTPLSESLDQASGIQWVDPSRVYPGLAGGYFRNFFSLDQTQFK